MCKSLRSVSCFTRFTPDPCSFILQCKQKSVLQSFIVKMSPYISSCSKVMTTTKRCCFIHPLIQGTHMPNMIALSLTVKKIWAMLKFFESRSMSRSRSRARNYHRKGLVIRNTHAKYESPMSYFKKVMCRVKVFQM